MFRALISVQMRAVGEKGNIRQEGQYSKEQRRKKVKGEKKQRVRYLWKVGGK